MKWLTRHLSPKTCATVELIYFGLTKIPLLFFVRPSVVDFSAERVVVKIRLRRRTANHLGSMYFGALAIGADCAGGLLAMQRIRDRSEPIALIFKDFHAEFLKRPEGDVHFVCEQGPEITALVDQAAVSDQRVEMPVHLTAVVPAEGPEPVARFALTLSLKKKNAKQEL